MTANGNTITGVTETSTGRGAARWPARPCHHPSAAAGSGLGNYTVTYVDGKLTVNPAALVITADSASKIYGNTATFASTAFTETGLVTANGNTITGVTETRPGAYRGADRHVSDRAERRVGNGLGNYTISYVDGRLTVNAAALTITADSASKTYGNTGHSPARSSLKAGW